MPPHPQAEAKPKTEVIHKAVDDRPLILVNLTVLTDGALHNRFDKASCNDPDLKRYGRLTDIHPYSNPLTALLMQSYRHHKP